MAAISTTDPTAGKLRRPGFGYLSSKRETPSPRLERCRRRFIPLLASSSPGDPCLSFAFRTGAQELLRFSPTPIYVKYQVRYPNSQYEEGSNDAEKKHQYIYTTNSEADKPRGYLDSLSLSSCFFSHADLNIDNEQINVFLRSPGYIAGFYSVGQRIFMSPEERSLYFGIGDTCIFDQRQREDPSKPPLKNALESLNCDSKTDPQSRAVRLSLDGVPLLSYPLNFQLARIRNQKPVPTFSFLPPSTEVSLVLHRYVVHFSDLRSSYL